jgi:hypothetical protein
MRAQTYYRVHHTIDSGSAFRDGPPLALTTRRVAASLPKMGSVKHAPPASNGVLLRATLFSSPVATDLDGNVLWYYPQVLNFMTQPVAGGRFMGIVEDGTADLSRQVIREFDLAGLTTLETNVARINEQLAALGKPAVNAFHHEARRLPDGRILTLAGLERVLTDVQGPGPVDVLGEMIIVLSPELEVVWTWDAFEHLDPSRRAVLGETCAPMSCAPLYQAARATDWLHANSVTPTPDGNLLLSCRHQDWLVKIDYRNGAGSGRVIWRLGKDADFRLDSTDPYPWFSHQHHAGFVEGSNTRIVVFDNGNTRRLTDPAAHSRGQVIELDEANRTARLVLNADLGAFCSALGAAQELPNGNYHFGCGLLPDMSSESMEISRMGEIVYSLQTSGFEYRTYRMRDLYTAP